jgi:hypothetical protein
MTPHKEGERDAGSLERGLVSTVVGLVAAVLVIISVEPLLQRLYPLMGVGPVNGPATLARTPDSLPPSSLLLLLCAYALASLAGGFAASLIFRRRRAWPAVTTGAVLMIAGSYAVLIGHQPLWFRAASFLTYPMAYLGHLVVRRTR